MLYPSAQAWRDAPEKRVLLFGMSGLGKTHIASLLRQTGSWFHYSVDYRIGTRYMGEHIADNFKRQAMQVPLLRDLLMTNSVTIRSNITFDNLAPLSTYLGKPGDPDRGGLSFDVYMQRQNQHRQAEIAALHDSAPFITRAQEIYGYPHFVCDTGGSICEVVDPADPKDPVMTQLAEHHLLIWLEGSESHTDELVRRFDRAPKPMYYHPDFLVAKWDEYLSYNNVLPDNVNPDDFIRWTYGQALAHRQPRYRAMAENWGTKVCATALAQVTTEADFIDLVATALP